MDQAEIKKVLRKNVLKVKDSLKLLFYQKEQHYNVRYAVTLKNICPSPNQLAVLLPLPLSKDTQIIESNEKFFPDEPQCFQEKKFLNRYAVWNMMVSPNEEIVCGYTFTVQVHPQIYDPSEENVHTTSDVLKRESYLESCLCARTDDPRIQDMVNTVLANGSVDTFQIMQALNSLVMEYLTYGKPIEGLYSSSDALDRRMVDCGGFNSLLIALAHQAGIPARMVSGFWAGYPARVLPGFWLRDPKNTMHAWVELCLPGGQWIGADPAVEKLVKEGKAFQSGRLGFLGSDRISMSYGCDMDLDIGGGRVVHTDILQNPLVFSEHGLGSFEKKTVFETKFV